eukprot:TRINITY_DN1713_c1_g2_i1.p1 TRINITY_DN1713_c1_g2~~TRINITY_DN1713_c1_g2_i1.p1  ORF type:complete len:231 (+),score=73.70 TRINITY_DN1713_c1_g2_i1:60-752(+)
MQGHVATVMMQQVEEAGGCMELWDLVGEDFWVLTDCKSTAIEGKLLEGTRLTLQKTPVGFDFSIRTPCMPQRWNEYETEMTAAWKDLCRLATSFDWSDDAHAELQQPEIARVCDVALRLTFYWYNFMPLARGTAAVGIVTLLGTFLAFNLQPSASIPKGMQVDWEAILCSDAALFSSTISEWMLPTLRRGGGSHSQAAPVAAPAAAFWPEHPLTVRQCLSLLCLPPGTGR